MGPQKVAFWKGNGTPCFKEMWADYYIDGIFLDFFECAPQKMGPDELGKGSKLETVTEMSKKIPTDPEKDFLHRCPKSPNMKFGFPALKKGG